MASIGKSKTTPYHPISNRMLKRMNQPLLNMLGCLSYDQKADWKKLVATVVRAYSASRRESTGYSPHYFMFGKHPSLPIDETMSMEQQDEVSVHLIRFLIVRFRLQTFYL